MSLRPRPRIRHLTPYEWEASTSQVAAEAGLREAEVVRFDTNTTPWPPVAWERILADLPHLPVNEYPHPSNEPLRSMLAARFDVAPDQVVVTHGADEALYLIATVFLGPRRLAVLAQPTFAMFRIVTEAAGGVAVGVEVDDAWDLRPDDVLRAVSDSRVHVVWLCSPNNPTGRTIPRDLVTAVARKASGALVVVDEAYAEIADQTIAPLLKQFPNLAMVRTFSKGYGLAGARVGYVVTSRATAALLDTVRPPQNQSVFGLAAACHALADDAALQTRIQALRAERGRLATALEMRQWQVVPSQANFLLTRPPRPAAEVARWLRGAGLVVRTYQGSSRLDEWLRITVRSPEDDARLLARLDHQPSADQDQRQGT